MGPVAAEYLLTAVALAALVALPVALLLVSRAFAAELRASRETLGATLQQVTTHLEHQRSVGGKPEAVVMAELEVEKAKLGVEREKIEKVDAARKTFLEAQRVARDPAARTARLEERAVRVDGGS